MKVEIEQTNKKWKLAKLIGLILVIWGIVFTLPSWFIVGLIVIFVGYAGAWWQNR
jgi:hypothetical protein